MRALLCYVSITHSMSSADIFTLPLALCFSLFLAPPPHCVGGAKMRLLTRIARRSVGERMKWSEEGDGCLTQHGAAHNKVDSKGA